MSVNFMGFDIATSGMAVNQRALEVAGHNISNLNTKGYSRQQAVFATARTRYVKGFQLGMGASVQEIRQIRSSFADAIYRQEVNNLGYWETRYRAIADLEAIIGEPMREGLQNALNDFWNSWQELSKAPDSLTVRALVRQRADALVRHINHMGKQIIKLQSDINDEIAVNIEQVNEITEKIAKLNVKIASAETAGNSANDYYDQRNYLVDKLSKLVKAEIRVMPDGQMDVIVGGYFLVNKGIQTKIYPAQNKIGSTYYIPKLEGTDVEIDVGQGIIKGLMEARGYGSSADGSFDNGTPNTLADIAVVVDVSNTSSAYLTKVRNSISKYAEELNAKGLDYNLRLITYDGSGVLSNTDFGTDVSSLAAAIPTTSTSSSGNDFDSVVTALETTQPFKENANRFALVFTEESIDGDEVNADSDVYVNRLKNAGVKVSVVTDTSYYSANGGQEGWDEITEETGGYLYDIDTSAADYDSMMTNAALDVNTEVNKEMATFSTGLDIISSIKKQLNALINITFREINEIHSSGKTLSGNDGGAFFEAIDSNYPMEMGNIKLSDDLNDLNNIVASSTDANGDNSVAVYISSLRNKNVISGEDFVSDIDNYYQDIILEVGNKGHDAERIMENQKKLVSSAESSRQSIMGVSIDEEMTSLIKYKYAYNASSKLINVINDMLDVMINRMGRVGL